MAPILLVALLAGRLTALPAAPAPRPLVATDSTRVERIGHGVYAIIHPDATEDWPHSNTGVIIGEDGVLVVDATYLPSRAAADIALIRRLTSLPVRYLVNTHWHYDHNNGNATYAAAFPGLTIISQHETRRIMAVNAARYARGVAAPGSPSAQALSRLVADTLQPGHASAAARASIAARANELAELATLQAVPASSRPASSRRSSTRPPGSWWTAPRSTRWTGS